ncbi:hypothetical protein LY76DRAFT_587475 [Colletotrichum caudatum]|nr:hypothetical protein LY76DRAFT_587475 [Colletotrichum caudatum]
MQRTRGPAPPPPITTRPPTILLHRRSLFLPLTGLVFALPPSATATAAHQPTRPSLSTSLLFTQCSRKAQQHQSSARHHGLTYSLPAHEKTHRLNLYDPTILPSSNPLSPRLSRPSSRVRSLTSVSSATSNPPPISATSLGMHRPRE